MKSLLFTLYIQLIIVFNPLNAQFWIKQNINFLTPTQGYDIKIVNDNVSWSWGRGGKVTNDVWEQSYLDYNFGRTVNGGLTWTTGTFPFNGKKGDLTSMSAIDDSTCWVTYVESTSGNFAAIQSKVYKTTNAGKEWTEVNVGIGSFWVDNIHFFDSNNGVIIADPGSVDFNIYTTSNGGASWSKLGGFNIPNVIDSDEYGVQSVLTTQGDKIWFNTYYNRIYYSADKGKSWIVWAAPTGATGLGLQMTSDEQNNVYCVIVDFNAETFQFVRRNLSEANWTDITPSDNAGFMYTTNIPETQKLIMHNVNDTKTRISSDKGKTWMVVDSLDTNSKNFLFFKNSKTGFTFIRAASTNGTKSFLKYSGSPLSGLLSQEVIDVDISIFPNPASDVLNIKMEGGKTNDYWLLINDLFGNLLYKKVVNQADHIFESVNIESFPQGIYNVTISNTEGSKSLNFTKI